VAIVRDVLRREGPVRADGAFYRLPLPADQGSGLGKALRSTVHPLRADLPVHLAAEGPKNIALAAEIADGWLPLFYAPRLDAEFRGLLAEGFARRGPGLREVEEFEVTATVPVVLGPDVEQAADAVRPFVALYAGGMGARGANFHADALARLGYAEACSEIQAHYLAGDRARAAAAVPTELVRDIALVGTPQDVREQARAWQGTAVTTLLVQTAPAQVAQVADLLRG
jgi:F420-dependent oxidoreductase-like protein